MTRGQGRSTNNRRDSGRGPSVGRWLALVAGWGLLVLGLVIGPIPGPWSIPIAALGLAILVRYSPWVRRKLEMAEERYPQAIKPVRQTMDKFNGEDDEDS